MKMKNKNRITTRCAVFVAFLLQFITISLKTPSSVVSDMKSYRYRYNLDNLRLSAPIVCVVKFVH